MVGSLSARGPNINDRVKNDPRKQPRGKPNRDQNGYFSDSLQNSNEKKVQFKNFNSDFSVAFTNSKEIYVASATNISVFNVIGGNLLNVLQGHEHKIISLWNAQDKESEWIVSCDEKGTVNYWNTKTRQISQDKTVHLLRELETVVDAKALPGAQNKSSGEALLSAFISHCSLIEDDKFLFTLGGNRKAKELTEMHIVDLKPGRKRRSRILDNVLRGQHKVSWSYDKRLIGAVFIGRVVVVSINQDLVVEKTKHHMVGNTSYPVILKFHPTTMLMAVGYNSGMVQLWRNVMDRYPVKTFLHWHTMPVRALHFSYTGEDLFTGGDECVLVRWSLSADNEKSFLPRMGMPIRDIESDATNEFVAVMHSDLGLSVVSSREMRLLGLIQTLTLHLPQESGDVEMPPLTAGLLYHPPTGAVVKNSKTGHLQFFRPQSNKVIFNLDIAMSNFVTEEREKKLPNTEVTRAALSDDGLWLVTNETCSLTQNFTEIVLKFWYFDLQNKGWQLNTSVQMPHTDTINCMAIRPFKVNGAIDEQSYSPVCLTGSQDGQIKFWKLVTYIDPTGKTRNHWNSRSVREFRDLPATACDFAPDGSLLSVAFGAVVTLWDPEEAAILGTLSQPYLKDKILDVSFSRGDWQGSFLLVRCESYVCSWDLLTCSLLWRACLTTSCWAVDCQSGLVAVFSRAREVYFFTPISSQPLSSESNLSKNEVIRAIFVPKQDSQVDSTEIIASTKSSTTNSLYCFDSKQNMLTLDHPYSASPSKLHMEDAKSPSANDQNTKSEMYSALVARTRTRKRSNVESETTPVNLLAPSVNALMKDLHALRIHNLSFDSLKDHIGSFLPDLREENDDLLTKAPKYSTVEDGYFSHLPLASEEKLPGQKEAKDIESIQAFDFTKLLSKIQSS